jgi:hypothetical protein
MAVYGARNTELLPSSARIVIIFLVGMGFELRALHLQIYCLSHVSNLFCSGYFGDGGVS